MAVKGLASQQQANQLQRIDRERPSSSERSRGRGRSDREQNDAVVEQEAAIRRGPRDSSELPPTYNPASTRVNGKRFRSNSSNPPPVASEPATPPAPPAPPAQSAPAPSAPQESAPPPAAGSAPSQTPPAGSSSTPARGERVRIQISIARDAGFASPAAEEQSKRRAGAVDSLKSENAPVAKPAEVESEASAPKSFDENFADAVRENSPGSSAVFQSPSQQLDQLLAEQALSSLVKES